MHHPTFRTVRGQQGGEQYTTQPSLRHELRQVRLEAVGTFREGLHQITAERQAGMPAGYVESSHPICRWDNFERCIDQSRLGNMGGSDGACAFERGILVVAAKVLRRNADLGALEFQQSVRKQNAFD